MDTGEGLQAPSLSVLGVIINIFSFACSARPFNSFHPSHMLPRPCKKSRSLKLMKIVRKNKAVVKLGFCTTLIKHHG